MTKTHRNLALTAEASFHNHYASFWGEERWHSRLFPALQAKTRYACMLNRYAPLVEGERRALDPRLDNYLLGLPARDTERSGDDAPLRAYIRTIPTEANALVEGPKDSSDEPFPAPSTSMNQLQTHWNLDAASLLVVHLLDVVPGNHVLDLCAAPGGKSIAIAQMLFPHLYTNVSRIEQYPPQENHSRTGSLRSNELDSTRHRRLVENLKSYLPTQLFDTKQIIPLRVDGSKPGVEAELRIRIPNPNGTGSAIVGYDKVLVDAPCSSERHIIHAHVRAKSSGQGTAQEMSNWRAGSSRKLSKMQAELLMTGVRMAKVGGTVMYATCSIESIENDGVIEKVLTLIEKEKKKGAKWGVKLELIGEESGDGLEKELEKWGERTKYGWIVLPDHPSGGRWGPLFFAKLTKYEVNSNS